MPRKAKGPRAERAFAEIGERLYWTRLALQKKTQAEFVAGTGIKRNSYTEFETGERRITLEAALELCNHYGLSLDWIYFGRLGTVDDPYLVRAISEERAKHRTSKRQAQLA